MNKFIGIRVNRHVRIINTQVSVGKSHRKKCHNIYHE